MRTVRRPPSGDSRSPWRVHAAFLTLAVLHPAVAAPWTVGSDQLYAGFADSASTAGDVNGDGFADVAVAAWGYSNGQHFEGRVYLYLGSATGPSGVPSWIAESDSEAALFGSSLSYAGDVNGDGYGDLIVGAPGYRVVPGRIQGKAYLFLRSPDGLEQVAAWAVSADQDNAWFGSSVATAGDVDGDGYADVIVGADNYENPTGSDGPPTIGAAFVYRGAPDGLEAAPSWIARSDQDEMRFATTVSSAGDVNGDGFGDVVVGASTNSGSYDRVRSLHLAQLYLGSPRGLSSTASWRFDLEHAPDVTPTGSPVAAGDVNGDGYDDLALGVRTSQAFHVGSTEDGWVDLYLGSAGGLSATASWTVRSADPSGPFGGVVASAGDTNGDGFGDLVVGAPDHETAEPEGAGLVNLYRGSVSGLSATEDWSVGHAPFVYEFGRVAASAGDVNGDGLDDVIAGGVDGSRSGDALDSAYVFLSVATPAGSVDTDDPPGLHVSDDEAEIVAPCGCGPPRGGSAMSVAMAVAAALLRRRPCQHRR